MLTGALCERLDPPLRYRDDMTGGGPRVIETQSIRQPESDGFYEHAQEHFSEHAQEHL